MGYLQKIQSAIADPNIRLLGQISLSDKEYSELMDLVRYRVSRMQQQISPQADIYLSVALVQIAIRQYREGNYWECFKYEMRMDIPSQRLQYIGQIFLATLKKYHYFQIERAPGDKYAYVENIKAHAFVPNAYLEGYFDFLFAFYDQNLLRQLPDSIDEDFSEMSEFFTETLRENSDSFKLDSLSSNKPAKTYKLLKATRVLFAQGDPSVLAREMYSHLKIIDDYYYDGILSPDQNRFAAAFSKWVETTTEHIRNDKSVAKRRQNVFYRKPYFYIDRASSSQYLYIPPQKIRSEDFDGTVYVRIASNFINRQIPLRMYRAFGVLDSEPERITVPDIFSEYQITVVSKSEREFKIPQKNYRFFDEDFYEQPKLRGGQNYMLVRKDSTVSGVAPVYVNTVCPFWNEYSFSDIDDKSVIYVDGVPLSTTGRFVEGADYAQVSSEYELFENGNKVQTAYRHPTVSFCVSKDALEGSFIFVRDKRIHVRANASSVADLPGEADICGVTVKLDELRDLEDGLYRVLLLEPRKKPRILAQYVMLHDLRCHPEKPRYIFTEEALVTVTGNYDVQPINCDDTGDGANYILRLDETAESADYSLRIDDRDYTVKVPVRVFKHGFEGKLSSAQPEYLWYTELKNDFYISMPGATEATVSLSSKEVQLSSPGVLQGNGLFRFDLSVIAQYILTSKQPYHTIYIKYKDNKDRKLRLYKVLNTVYVERADIILDDSGNVAVSVQYKGKSGLALRFDDKETGAEVAEYTVQNGLNPLPALSRDGFYNMHMFEIIPDPFGFGITKKEIDHPRIGVGAIDLNDISNCKIMIRSIIWRGNILKTDFTYGLFHLKRINEVTYVGKLFERKNKDASNLKYKTTCVAEEVLIECLPGPGTLAVISLQSEYDDGVYDPLYYDQRARRLLESDSVTGRDYNRFIALYDDNAVFETEIRRVI